MRFRTFHSFRTYNLLIPTCAFGFLPLSARTTRRFLPVLSVSSHFPHVRLADPYLRFRPLLAFRMYGSPIPTCTFGFLPLSARTTRRFLPALSTSPCPPHVRLADSYLRFRLLPAFRTHCSLIPTCAFSLFPFPHVQSADPYMRFQPFPISARTDRRFLHASPLPPRFPHVHPADSYMLFQPDEAFSPSVLPTVVSRYTPENISRRFWDPSFPRTDGRRKIHMPAGICGKLHFPFCCPPQISSPPSALLPPSGH